LLCDRRFWGYAIGYTLMSCIMLGYYAAMPFWFVQQWGIPEQYYAFFALISVAGYILGLVLSRFLARRHMLIHIVLIGLIWALISGIISTAITLLGWVGIPEIIIAMSLWSFGAGIVFPAAGTGVAFVFKTRAGMASALLTTSMFFAAGLMSWVESHMNSHHFIEMAIMMIGFAIVGIIINRWGARHADLA